MRAYPKIALSMLLLCGVLLAVRTTSVANETQPATDAENAGGNSKCYVCHPTLKTEDITTQHLVMHMLGRGAVTFVTGNVRNEMLRSDVLGLQRWVAHVTLAVATGALGIGRRLCLICNRRR